MNTSTSTPNIHNRVTAVLKGEKPDRLPFIDRLELWYLAHQRADDIPEPYTNLSLTETHRAIRFGQMKMIYAFQTRLHGVEMVCRLNGEEYLRETDPLIGDFPRGHAIVQQDKPGETEIEFITPVGTLTIKHALLPTMVASGLTSYKTEHFIKDVSDLDIVEWVLERAEYVPQFDLIRAEQERIGDIGFILPMLMRIPFQQIMIDYISEVQTFYWLYDEPERIARFMALLDEHMVHTLRQLADFDWAIVEFSDNLEVEMTNPKLFETYCLPYYQRYADILHGQGKKMSSHTDGNLKLLFPLLKESGLDVCESISPQPLTPYTFDEVWRAWNGHPLIWGGIPSPILEARTPESEFQAYIDHVLDTIGSASIILGVGDMVMDINLIERVKYIADQVEAHVI